MLNLLSFHHISTEITLVISGLLLLLLGLVLNKKSKIYSYLSIVVLVVCSFIVFAEHGKEKAIVFNSLFILDRYSVFAKLAVLISAIVSILFTLGYSAVIKSYLKSEYSTLILFAVLGMMIMLSANDFMSLYLGIELQSLCLYSLTAFEKDNTKCTEAALKYFILGALATGFSLYGISLIYGFSGTTNFSSFIELYNNASQGSQIPIAVVIGIVLVIVGFCFKISAVPFHMWAPDVYQGAPLPMTVFFSTTSKMAALFLLAKLLLGVFNIWVDAWQQVIKAIAILSLFVGALGALRQNDIKRLLAYSSISHIGFILIGIASHSILGLQAVVVYIIIYVLMNVGMFAFVAMLQSNNLEENFDLSIFKGLSKTNPIMALSIAALLLSMAGIPPLAGFLAKFYILSAAVKEGLYVIATLGLLSAVISTFYYLKIIKLMYFDTGEIRGNVNLYTAENLVISSFSTTFNLALIFFPTSLYGVTAHMVEGLFG